jgi:hypothetical protein
VVAHPNSRSRRCRPTRFDSGSGLRFRRFRGRCASLAPGRSCSRVPRGRIFHRCGRPRLSPLWRVSAVSEAASIAKSSPARSAPVWPPEMTLRITGIRKVLFPGFQDADFLKSQGFPWHKQGFYKMTKTEVQTAQCSIHWPRVK